MQIAECGWRGGRWKDCNGGRVECHREREDCVGAVVWIMTTAYEKGFSFKRKVTERREKRE